jgi:hypothetical protein
MLKKKLRPALLLAVSLLAVAVQAHDTHARSRIFVLDSSGSMRKNRLFDRIKHTIKEEYIPDLRPNDHVMLLTFDEKVNILLDEAIQGQTDLQAMAATIDRLEARGPWTWLSKALEVTSTQAARLKAQYPGEPLTVYLLTDGVNDPPPSVGEPMLKFVEVLSRHFGDFTMEGAYVYVLLFRGSNEVPAVSTAESDTLLRRTQGHVMVRAVTPTSTRPIPPEVVIGSADTDLGTIDLSKGPAARAVTLLIKEATGDVKGKTIDLACSAGTFPAYQEFKVDPVAIPVERAGQAATVSIRLPASLPPGNYAGTLRLSCPGTLLSPTSVDFRFAVAAGGTHTLAGAVALAVAAMVAAGYLGFLAVRRQALTIREPDKEARLDIVVRGMRATSLEGFGLAGHSLRFGRSPANLRSLLLYNNDGPVCRVELGRHITCDTPQGNRVIVLEKPAPKAPAAVRRPPDPPAAAKPDVFEEPARSPDPDAHFRGDVETRE